MQSTDPPSAKWHENAHAISKTFRFESLSSATAFCLALLQCPHHESDQVSAIEERATRTVQVSIFTDTSRSKKDTIRLIESIESFFRECLQDAANTNQQAPTSIFSIRRISIWPWKNTG